MNPNEFTPLHENEVSTQAPMPPLVAPPHVPVGEAKDDREPLHGVAGVVDALLRHPRRIIFQLSDGASPRLTLVLLLVATGLVAAYGVIVGSFSGGVQWLAVPVKITAGLLVSAMICLPSLYVFTALSGSAARLNEIVGALAAMLALIGLLLAGFGPVAWLFSQSSQSVALMGCLHILFWLVAVPFGARLLIVAFRHFELRSATGLRVWLAVFVLVSLQMMTSLRPLVGTSDLLLPMEKKFFLTHWNEVVSAEAR